MLLNNGIEIPGIGLGASIVKDTDAEVTKAQRNIYEYAIKNGCTLFDTSSSYGRNEQILGDVIHNFGKREEIFLMVKISNAEQRTGEIALAYQKALSRLNTEYVDLLMLHWPQKETYLDSWRQMVELYEQGKVRAIGVSNFHAHHLAALQSISDIVPAVNQIEVHPLFTQKALISYCKERNIQVVSYCPFGRMHDVLVNSRPLRVLSKKYSRTVPQIILKWNIQLGLIPIPRTLNPSHLDEFIGLGELGGDFQMTEEEITWIDSINENIRLRYNPDTCDFSIL